MSAPSPSEESIPAAALQIPGIEQRARFLDQVCNDDAAARRASEMSKGRNPWATLAQCLADYREGRFAEVDSSADRVLGIAADNNPLRGQALALRAMARWRRGHREQARAHLEEMKLRLPRSRYRTPLVPAILEDNEMAMILLYEEAAGLLGAPFPRPGNP